jgi:hypothetical protein
LSFCQLINEVGLNGTEGKCLFSQYGTSNIEDLLSYWNASSKDLETAEKVKAYILGQCNGSFTPRLADLLKENFCLSQHPIDLMENIKNQCGLSSFDSGEWFDAFNSGLSECTKSIILDDWFDLTNAEKDNLLNNPALYDQVVNFVKSEGCSVAAKDFASDIIPQIIQHDLMFLTEDDLSLMFNNPNLRINYLQFLTDNPNLTQDDKAAILRTSAVAPNDPIENLADRLSCFNITSNTNFTHRVSIYVDQPVANSNLSASSKELAGHTWILLEQDQGNGTVVTLSVGLYPEDFATPCHQIDGGAYNDDEGHPFDVSVTWPVSDYGFNILVNDLKSQPFAPLYNLSTYNCSTFAVEKLNQLGFNIPATNIISLPNVLVPAVPPTCHIEGIAPGQLGQDLRNNYPLPAGATKNITGGSTPTSSCH